MFGPETVLVNTDKKVSARVGNSVRLVTNSGVIIEGQLRTIGSMNITLQDNVIIGYGIIKSVSIIEEKKEVI